MKKEDLIQRNRRFAIDVLRVIAILPQDRVYDSLARQLARCSISIGANYRAACRAKSTADFINKLKIVEEEADESNYFLDLILAIDSSNQETLKALLRESSELIAIYTASLKTVKGKSKPKL